MNAASWLALGAAMALLVSAPRVRADEVPPLPPKILAPPDQGYTYAEPRIVPTSAWAITQLVPSPQLAIGENARGETQTAFGLRWQLTPVLWSWGVNRRLSRWRYFVVDPLARMSGSLALEANIEYVGGHVDRALVRPALKATLPLLHRGEYLALSLGTSIYKYDDRARVAHDVGLYFLYGTIGIVGTYAPNHSALQSMVTLRLRYF